MALGRGGEGGGGVGSKQGDLLGGGGREKGPSLPVINRHTGTFDFYGALASHHVQALHTSLIRARQHSA